MVRPGWVVALLLLGGCSPTASPPRPIAIQSNEAVDTRSSEAAITPSSEAAIVPPKPQRDPNAVVAITYEDLNLPMPPDAVFQDWMLTQRVRDLDGTRVRIGGFMCAGSIFTQRNIKNFMLLREKECPYGPGGEAHHVIAVELKEVVTHYTTNLITLEGILRVRPFKGPNGKTWAVYHLEASAVE